MRSLLLRSSLNVNKDNYMRIVIKRELSGFLFLLLSDYLSVHEDYLDLRFAGDCRGIERPRCFHLVLEEFAVYFGKTDLDGSCGGVALFPRKLLRAFNGALPLSLRYVVFSVGSLCRFPVFVAAPYGYGFSIAGEAAACAHAVSLFLNVIKDNYMRIVFLRELSGACSCCFRIFGFAEIYLVSWIAEDYRGVV